MIVDFHYTSLYKNLFQEYDEKLLKWYFIYLSGTKETAFIYAVLSAGVVHSVTQACSAGNLTDCSCDMSRYGESDVEGWKWGGCSDNVNYGLWFAKSFVDAPETIRHEDSRNIRNLMNLHNNEVGRKVSIQTKLVTEMCQNWQICYVECLICWFRYVLFESLLYGKILAPVFILCSGLGFVRLVTCS